MAAKITDADRRRRVQPMLDLWAERLALTDWQITWEMVDKLSGEAAGGGPAGARVVSSGPYTRAHILLARHTIDEAALPSELEVTIIHELLHCLSHELREEVVVQVGEVTAVGKQIMWQVEGLCDRLAICLWRIAHQKLLAPGYSPVPGRRR